MRQGLLRLALIFGLSALAPAAGRAQAPADSAAAGPTGFERRYLDPDELRDERVLLHDWPALTRLVRWADRLEEAAAVEDQTLSAELLNEFRLRVDSLGARPLPPFLAARGDRVQAVLDSLAAHLDRAEAALAVLPPAATPTGDAVPNEPEQRRTVVTGRTAVTVPAGIQVGEADSLPAAALGDEAPNFVDLVIMALADLDRIVHLTRTAGAAATTPRPRADPRSSSSPGRAPARPGP